MTRNPQPLLMPKFIEEWLGSPLYRGQAIEQEILQVRMRHLSIYCDQVAISLGKNMADVFSWLGNCPIVYHVTTMSTGSFFQRGGFEQYCRCCCKSGCLSLFTNSTCPYWPIKSLINFRIKMVNLEQVSLSKVEHVEQ